MRLLASFVAAGLVFSAPALVGAQPASTAAPPAATPEAATAPAESTGSVTSSTTPPAVPGGQTPAAAAAGQNTTATAVAGVTVGEPVKDKSGSTIGEVTGLGSSNGQQTAIIKMGTDSFQVPTDRLGVADGAATINMTQAQIEAMLHPRAGGR